MISWGFCVQDMWDWDRDGDVWESVGSCGGILCASVVEERCGDLLDNDHDGHVDETCEGCVCTPGSWRYSVDDGGYGSLWAIPYCNEDGSGWGRTYEIPAIPEPCDLIDHWYSPPAQECCIEQGWCCQDMWDMDSDGDIWESLGRCPDPICPVEH